MKYRKLISFLKKYEVFQKIMSKCGSFVKAKNRIHGKEYIAQQISNMNYLLSNTTCSSEIHLVRDQKHK
jgi:hypothetical protein